MTRHATSGRCRCGRPLRGSRSAPLPSIAFPRASASRSRPSLARCRLASTSVAGAVAMSATRRRGCLPPAATVPANPCLVLSQGFARTSVAVTLTMPGVDSASIRQAATRTCCDRQGGDPVEPVRERAPRRARPAPGPRPGHRCVAARARGRSLPPGPARARADRWSMPSQAAWRASARTRRPAARGAPPGPAALVTVAARRLRARSADCSSQQVEQRPRRGQHARRPLTRRAWPRTAHAFMTIALRHSWTPVTPRSHGRPQTRVS